MPLDLVAVPASRPAENLRHAAEVAALAGAHLLVLCSGRTRAGAAHRVVTEVLPSDRVTVVEVSASVGTLSGLTLKADASELVKDRRSDTSLKRNLAIALARSLGWRRLLFLDDDVRGLAGRELDIARSVLTDRRGAPAAVGWAFDDYPDNSMVCHAYREAGGPQRTFIGAGALAIRIDDETPFFPLMYNEDWLFMLPLMLKGRSNLVLAGTLTQDRFDPFAVPADAVKQEAGDLLAESLFRLIHRKQPMERALEPGYWRDMLAHRRKFIVAIKGRVAGQDSGKICDALDKALLMQHKQAAWPTELRTWVLNWQGDLGRWKVWLGRLNPAETMAQALANLSLVAYRPDTKLRLGAGRPFEFRRPTARRGLVGIGRTVSQAVVATRVDRLPAFCRGLVKSDSLP